MNRIAILITTVLAALASHGADRIGNGGGLWACEVNKRMTKAMLIDLYEARTQFDLSLIQLNTADPANQNPEQIALTRWAYFQRAWPQLTEWLGTSFHYVLQSRRLTAETLIEVTDVAALQMPNQQNCREGAWRYVQFANFTPKGVVLISQELWESPAIPTLDKAALLWHEAVYHWLRIRNKDQDSRRAREIVGLLFSTEPIEKVRAEVTRVLNESNNNPPAPSPGDDSLPFLCVLETRMPDNAYVSEASDEQTARTDVLQTCRSDMPIFNNCGSAKPKCERAESHQDVFSCEVEDTFFQKTYVKTGRSRLEAGFRAREACGKGRHCSPVPRCTRIN